MEDYISEKRQARRNAFDHLTANPTINTVAVAGMVVDRAGHEHSGPDELSAVENGISNWVCREWREAADLDTGASWDAMSHMLYGALQSNLNHGNVAVYIEYSFLANLARERRHRAIVDGFGDDE